VPQGTTGASAAVQATENAAVSNTDEVWGNVTVPVCTIAGQQDVSRQSLERGTPGLDALVYLDLAGAYYAAQEAQVLSGSGAAGQMLGIFNTAGVNQATAFVAAATAATFQTKVAGQVSAIAANRFLSPTHIAMAPRRWAWLLGQSDSSGRPLVTPTMNGPQNAVSVGDGAHACGVTDSYFQGLRVVVSASLPLAVGTGPEDQVIVYRASDLLLWQAGDGMPAELRFEQTLGNQLTVKLVAYGYSGFTAGRYPKAVGIVGGNSAAGFGLIAPTF
jgi:HK97 family phage major capsid protein